MESKKTTKKVEKEEKKVVKKEEKEEKKVGKKLPVKRPRKNYSLTPKDSTDILLVIIFAALLILTVFLGFRLKAARDDLKEHVRANIIVPVLGKDMKNTISVDVENMKKGQTKEYIFKVSNTKEESINPEEVIYHLQFVYGKNVSLEVTKNDSTDNILGEDNYIKSNKLQKEETQEDIYTVKIKALKDTKAKELVTINIMS